jgi:hypothetical protein
MVKSFRFETETIVDASVDACWAVLSDPRAHRAKWEPGCKEAKVVGKSGMHLIIEHVRDLPGVGEVRRKMKGALHPVGRIDWRVEEGYEKGSQLWDIIQPVGDENKARVVFSGEVLPQRSLGFAASLSRKAAAEAYAAAVKPDLESFKRYVEKLPPPDQGEGWAYINLE